MRVLGARQPAVGRSHGVETAPVAPTEDPGQHVHLEVQLGGELGADQVGRAGALPPREQPPALVVAALLRRQRGRVAGERGADAGARRRLVHVQALGGAAGVAPPEGPATRLVGEADHRVGRRRRVGAGAAGQLGQHLVEVALEEVALAAQPLLAGVHVWRLEGSRTLRSG